MGFEIDWDVPIFLYSAADHNYCILALFIECCALTKPSICWQLIGLGLSPSEVFPIRSTMWIDKSWFYLYRQGPMFINSSLFFHFYFYYLLGSVQIPLNWNPKATWCEWSLNPPFLHLIIDGNQHGGLVCFWPWRLPLCQGSFWECCYWGRRIYAQWPWCNDQCGSWQAHFCWTVHQQAFGACSWFKSGHCFEQNYIRCFQVIT